MTLLSLRSVDAYYGRAQILHGVSLDVAAGERVAILGRNGVGKTTIVNACLGVAKVRQGRIAFNGREIGAIRHFTAAHPDPAGPARKPPGVPVVERGVARAGRDICP